MQYIPQELIDAIKNRLKVGEYAKPVCRVEVDKLAFIPGRIEEVEFVAGQVKLEKQVVRTWINSAIDDKGEVEYLGESVIGSTAPAFPVRGKSLSNVTSRFGMRNGKLHEGIDIAASVGTDVVAAWDGTVVNVSTSSLYNGYGYYVDILHEGGILTRYAHLSKIYVRRGQRVSRGEVIGAVGNTGNVRSGGKPVEGSYSDPNSPRSKGVGAHLHFEIRLPTSKGEKKPVDPEKYLDGSNSLFTDSYNVGDITIGETYTGYLGEVKLNETFNRHDWYKKSIYTVDPNFKNFSVMSSGSVAGYNGTVHTFLFDPAKVSTNVVVGFNIKITLNRNGFMDLGFITDLGSADELRIFENGKLVRRIKGFEKNKYKAVKGIAIPKGTNNIRIEVRWVRGSKKQYFSLANILIQELIVEDIYLDEKTKGQLDPTLDPTRGAWVEQTIEGFIFGQRKEKRQLQVGQFVYSETLVLSGIQSIEIDNQFEMESAEARIVVANPDGTLNPDYNPYLFPEIGKDSPYTYTISGGYLYSVLSENTPIRIYLGYGQNLVRVFTGLIDKVDSGDGVITITCRDMYKKILEKVLTETKSYPQDVELVDGEKVAWVKSAVVQDLVAHAGMFGWRGNYDDRQYPDAIIEETYLIEVDQKTGMVVKAVPGKEGEFTLEPISSILTPAGWLNPFVEEYGRTFAAYSCTVADAINEILKDTNYRSYCDRYGTYRLEQIKFDSPVVAEFTDGENIVTISKTVDTTRCRSHLVIVDETGKEEHFIDKEILLDLKGEVRTAVVEVPWAKSYAMKKLVAERMFFDMKRISKTLQVAIIGNPALDILDKIAVYDKSTATRGVYTIKGIRTNFTPEGYIQVIDLTWFEDKAVV